MVLPSFMATKKIPLLPRLLRTHPFTLISAPKSVRFSASAILVLFILGLFGIKGSEVSRTAANALGHSPKSEVTSILKTSNPNVIIQMHPCEACSPPAL